MEGLDETSKTSLYFCWVDVPVTKNNSKIEKGFSFIYKKTRKLQMEKATEWVASLLNSKIFLWLWGRDS